MGMKWEWQRLKKPLGLRSRRCVGTTASKRVENVYYPPAICSLGSSGFKVDTASKEANAGKESPAKTLPLVQSPSKETKQPKVAKKLAEVTKEVAHDAIQPQAAPKDPSKEKEASHNMEIVLATLPIPTKEDLKGKGPASSTIASTEPPKIPKDKLVIKMKL